MVCALVTTASSTGVATVTVLVSIVRVVVTVTIRVSIVTVTAILRRRTAYGVSPGDYSLIHRCSDSNSTGQYSNSGSNSNDTGQYNNSNSYITPPHGIWCVPW
jgi:hypothetical protein